MYYALNTQNQSQKCLQLCERQDEIVTLTSSNFPAKATFSMVSLIECAKWYLIFTEMLKTKGHSVLYFLYG